jgi:uncharacterized membrane protein YraQ (UPF0718 family)
MCMRMTLSLKGTRHGRAALPAGWRRPSWPGLLVVFSVGVVFGLFHVEAFLLHVVFGLLVTGFAGFWFASFLQHASEGAVLVATAFAAGGFVGSVWGGALPGRTLAEALFSSALGFLFGLTFAPFVIAQSQRRGLTSAGSSRHDGDMH